jgi:protein O-GlcNAc transferase
VLIYGDVGMDPMAARLAALRLAPVQAMSTGHPVTTGLATMDLYLSSALMEPADGQDHYRERLVRLPNLSYAYRPLDPHVVPLARSDLGLPDDVPIYWCCQSLFKYLPVDDELFVRIATLVPDALFLFIDYMPAPRVALIFRQRLAAAFTRAGLNADRHCRFLPQMDHARFHAVAGLTDVFLDNPSWSGHNTALEALPHGLPIVTLPGALMRQRHSAGIVAMTGLTGTIAACRDEYVEIAVRLGLDRRARTELRRAVRQARCFMILHQSGRWRRCCHLSANWTGTTSSRRSRPRSAGIFGSGSARLIMARTSSSRASWPEVFSRRKDRTLPSASIVKRSIAVPC